MANRPDRAGRTDHADNGFTGGVGPGVGKSSRDFGRATRRRTSTKLTKKERAELIGLVGFVVSGAFFAVSAAKNNDGVAFAGSVVWTAACVVWIVALFATRR